MVRLRRSHPDEPGLARRRRGRGWAYIGLDGAPVQDQDTIERIQALVIPPAWRNVWISARPNGHIQAVGIDDAGRKQYLYHPDWSARRHALKFTRVAVFGAALPKARTLVAEQLAGRGYSRERALAVAFRLLDRGHFRIGGEVYAETNGSFGLATLRCDHVRRQGRELIFDYTAKSGLHRVERIADPELLAAIGGRLRRGAEVPELLAYRSGREWRRISGAEINAYLKHVTGQEISAKDFRTWHGTTMAAVALTQAPLELKSAAAMARAERQAVKAVSQQLGNTPAVCRGSYIAPRVLTAFEQGERITRAVDRAIKTLGQELPDVTDENSGGAALTMIAAAPPVERAVLKLLQR